MSMSEVITVQGACPVCKGDVVGNDNSLFFCKNCNMLFRRAVLEQ